MSNKYFKPDYIKWTFPAGEVGVKVNSFNTDDIMLLDFVEEKDIFVWIQIIVTYFIHAPFWSKKICFPYLPYARQDKLHSKGEAPILAYLLNLFTREGIKIYTYDPHVDLKNPGIEIVCDYSMRFKKILDFDYLCYPDKHSHLHGVHSCIEIPEFVEQVINFDKHRDSITHKVSLVSHDNLSIIEGKNILINDDICDGGATFIEVCKILKSFKPSSISLFVTHGIFSKGLNVLYENGIDHIYTTDTYCRLENTEELTVLPIIKDNLC